MFNTAKAKETPPAVSGRETLRRHARSWIRHHAALMAHECRVNIEALQDFANNKRPTLDEAALQGIARYMNVGVDYVAATDTLVPRPTTYLPTATAIPRQDYVVSNMPKSIRDRLPARLPVRYTDE